MILDNRESEMDVSGLVFRSDRHLFEEFGRFLEAAGKQAVDDGIYVNTENLLHPPS